MSKIVENPFKDMWDEFNLDEFKSDILSIIDEIYADDGNDPMDLLEEVDEIFTEFVMMLKFKNSDTLEIVPIENLPEDLIETLGISEEDRADGYVPKELIPPQYLDKIKGVKARKPKRDNWLI